MTFNLILKRISEDDNGTFGVLIHDNQPICCTVERPWLDNVDDTSCIPVGTYPCVPHNSDKFQNVWEVTGVKDRTAILIHAGNTINDTHGCVIVGRQFTPFGVALSQMALSDLRHILPSNFTLTIKEIT